MGKDNLYLKNEELVDEAGVYIGIGNISKGEIKIEPYLREDKKR